MRNSRNYAVFALLSIALFIASCSSGYKPKTKSEVKVHQLSDPEMLNPMNSSDAGASEIQWQLFQSLIRINYKTLEYDALVAEARPDIEKTENGGMKLTFKIRQDAVWDNGTPITAKDLEFTMKVLKHPKVNNTHTKPYFEFVKDIQLYTEDPKKITFVCDTVYFLAESVIGSADILPEYNYDPKGLLKEYTLPQIIAGGEKLAEEPKMKEFAEAFNSEKYMREKEVIVGSGPYKLTEWTTGQRVVLEKKKDWWGDKYADKIASFEAFADKLIYVTINDQTSSIVALKAGNIDVMKGIKPKDFVELPASEKYKENFNSYQPSSLQYTYIGLNAQSPKLKDKKVRQALAHLADVEKYIKTVYYGLAQPVIGPVHPSKTRDYNSEIKPYQFNTEKAKQLLEEAGWKDTNGDGTIDKVINGEKTEFAIDFSTNSGNDMRKQIALMFQEEARKVGIKVNVGQQDWSVYLDNQKKHNFEIYFGAWISSPSPNDFKQIFHSESALNEGSNYVSFNNAKADQLIDAIRVELDENKRAELNKEFQAILHEEVPYIFLFAPTERIAIHKKFTNAEASVMRPGYFPASFKLTAPAN
ncbi:MAG: hypothetical protein J0M08_10435 [Bacteroidetes bacterium]|nr:hypothetical protein [Bacteroidota bacterium]